MSKETGRRPSQPLALGPLSHAGLGNAIQGRADLMSLAIDQFFIDLSLSFHRFH